MNPEHPFSNMSEDPELLRLIFDVNPTLVFVKDRQGRFCFANKALAEVYGADVEDLLGKTDADFNPEIDEIEHFLADDLKVMDSREELFIAQEKVTDPAGGSVWLQTIKRPLISDDGTCNHLLGVCVDITARIEAEEREKNLRQRLSNYERLDSLGVMAGGIAHDLNNILGPLVGYPDLIRMQVEDPKVTKLVNEMQKSAERATGVIEDLLTLARRGVYKAKPISPTNCVDDFLNSAALKQIISDYPAVTIELNLTDETPTVLGSESHVHQILLNLVKNAFEAIDESGIVKIETGLEDMSNAIAGFEEVPSGSFMFLKVSDNGKGITKADREQIFDPFFSRKRKDGGGTGLGLAMVYAVVKDMSASIEVESRPGDGSSFVVRFPVVEGAEVQTNNQFADYRGDGDILIIDDMQPQRELAVRMLDALGYRVTTASHSDEGIERFQAKNQKFDLVLIDMMMGDGPDGLETYRRIQKLQPGLPCLLASGYSETERVNTGISEGVKGFVRKPYTQAVLGSAVNKALS